MPPVDHTNALIGITLVLVIVLASVLVFLLPRHYAKKREAERAKGADIITESFEMLGRELKSLKEQLIVKERLATLGEVSAGIAHEFRNPLAVILGNARLLQKGMAEGDPQREVAAAIVKEVETMNAVMEELLKFSKSEPIRREEIALARFMEGIASDYNRPEAVTLEVPEDLVIQGDETLLRQALKNLINNALDVGPRVWLAARRGQSGRSVGVFIEVRDSGPGLTPEEAEKVFTPFFTKKAGGIGIGLSLVQKIAIAHGGLADVITGSGKCCTFRIFLPFTNI